MQAEGEVGGGQALASQGRPAYVGLGHAVARNRNPLEGVGARKQSEASPLSNVLPCPYMRLRHRENLGDQAGRGRADTRVSSLFTGCCGKWGLLPSVQGSPQPSRPMP